MVEEVFNLFDTDGQQQLDVEELACAICAMGFCQTGYTEVILFLANQDFDKKCLVFCADTKCAVMPSFGMLVCSMPNVGITFGI